MMEDAYFKRVADESDLLDGGSSLNRAVENEDTGTPGGGPGDAKSQIRNSKSETNGEGGNEEMKRGECFC